MSPVPAGPPPRRPPIIEVWPRPVAFETCPGCQHIFNAKGFELPHGGRSRCCLHRRIPEAVEPLKACTSCYRAKPRSAFPPRGWLGCGSLWRLWNIGRAAGSREHESDGPDEGTREAVLGKWLELRKRLVGAEDQARHRVWRAGGRAVTARCRNHPRPGGPVRSPMARSCH
jgi:hypothetical protein